MIRPRRLAVAAVLAGSFLLTGCNALASEWEEKTGGEKPGEVLEAALADALPDVESVDVETHKNGFAQAATIEVSYAEEILDAAAVQAAARTICENARRVDEVSLEIVDAETGETLDVSGRWAEAFPRLDLQWTPGEELEIDVADDCPGILESP